VVVEEAEGNEAVNDEIAQLIWMIIEMMGSYFLLCL
jgi:hypothetical protein